MNVELAIQDVTKVVEQENAPLYKADIICDYAVGVNRKLFEELGTLDQAVIDSNCIALESGATKPCHELCKATLYLGTCDPNLTVQNDGIMKAQSVFEFTEDGVLMKTVYEHEQRDYTAYSWREATRVIIGLLALQIQAVIDHNDDPAIKQNLAEIMNYV